MSDLHDGKNAPNSCTVDELVGKRVRLRRSLLKLTQEDLAELCSLSPQQVHKYERGYNRMSAKRLVEFASALNIPVAWFFDGIETHPALPDDMLDLLAEGDALDLMLLYRDIKNSANRRHLLQIARMFAEESKFVDVPSRINGSDRRNGKATG